MRHDKAYITFKNKKITISMPKPSMFAFEGVDKGDFDFGETNK